MTYEESLERLSKGTQRIVQQLLDAEGTGALTALEVDTLLADVLAMANARGYDMGAMSIRAYVEAVTGEPYPLAAGPGINDRPRMGRAVDTIRNSGQDRAMQLARIAGAEGVNAARRGAVNEMRRNPLVKGWTRGLESDACELCVWWWREGRVFREEWVMPSHTGCMCHPVPVVTRSDENVQSERQAAAGQARNQRRNRPSVRGSSK